MSLLLGPAMLDSKLFVSRLNDPFPDLYERFWDGVEWIWVNHGRPGGMKMKGAPGAAMLDSKLFVVVDDGALWERHWREDLGRWAWEEHGRPENRAIVHGPDAAMMSSKFFVVTDDGSLWERHWREDLGRWAWEDHGRPENKKIVQAPGAAMMDEKLFVVVEDGALWERHWRADLGRWAWQDHGRPANKRIVTAPGAAMLNSKLFVAVEDGEVWERHWRGDAWAWENHGRPDNRPVVHAPGAAMMDSKFFVITNDGSMWERHWRDDLGRWAWQGHGQPDSRLTGPPGAAMLSTKLFVAGENRHLFERVWTGSEWKWVDHGTAFHDSSAHIIGAPGSDPKLEIAILGDGYAEGDMDAYRSLVESQVRAAFRLDQLGAGNDAIRVTRIDLVSPVSGVTEQRWDERGTVPASDDILLSENFRFSRLGLIVTGIWSHCWLDLGANTQTLVMNLIQRFAPAATNFVIIANSGLPGGCNRGNFAAFTRGEGATVIAHELGHNLFSLGDEYNNDTQNNTFPRGEANLTEQPSSWANLKWADLVAAGTPLPTSTGALPGGWDNNRSVGAFEGGGGNFSTGIFRPVISCRMNQNNPPWCPVCARRMDQVLGAFR